ncbi:protein-disulfide reductase DsbD [Catenovulum sp. 2E275]|uniref:protein-disulfide reductase DsbD n=1 Tax=Catenovulum sp. 2E275 TaxID=2980497 RepID=UPI0021CE32C8|nr:protein-disulfide reductase DsbD [Catenovulum sp. 2E275]MCU4675106.1 protein-disulfide reductase DsbD [Catenovulum sp. 2E275]
MFKSIRLQLVALILSLFSFAGQALDFSQLNSEPDFLPVEQAFIFDFDQQANTLHLSWQIADGYYLYKHRTKAKALAENNDAELEIKFLQQGDEKYDEYFGDVIVFHQRSDIEIDLTGITSDKILLTYQGCADAGLCYPPQLIEVPLLNLADAGGSAEPAKNQPASTDNQAVQNNSQNASNDIQSLFSNKSSLLIILGFFILGVGLSLTPCVLPMVPILSAIVTGQQNSTVKSGLILSIAYVLGMATFYTLSGVLVGYFGASFNLQLYLQTPAVVIVFTAIFIALAFAMFGYYDLALPASWQSKLQSATGGQDKKSLAATYLMGGISALALSPCVSAPLASALLYISTTGDGVLGGLALFALSIGMGLPLLAVGAGFSGLVPKAGGWMVKVKQVFGVMMLAMAVWMLERLFDPVIGAVLWAILGIWLAVKMNLISRQTTTAGKNEQAIALIIFVASLSWLAHNYFQQYSTSTGSTTQANAKQLVTRISTVAGLEQAMANASGKKVVVDLYADWCASCQTIEHEVFGKISAADYPEYVFLQLDLTEMTQPKQDFLNQHKLFGPPALLIFAKGEMPKNTEFVYQAEFNLAQFKQWLAR